MSGRGQRSGSTAIVKKKILWYQLIQGFEAEGLEVPWS